MKKKRKSIQSWSWILMITFLTLSIIDYRFGWLGVACIGTPLIHAIKGEGKVHCAYTCPRGSLLGKFLAKVSLGNNLPNWMKKETFKNILVTAMLVFFGFAMYHANADGFSFVKSGFAIFRLMTVSLLVGIILGVIYKPRSWCQVCPMGHGTILIDRVIKKKNKKVVLNNNCKSGSCA